MTAPFFNTLIEESRFLNVLYDNLPNEMKKDDFYKYIALYLEKYAQFNSINPEQAIHIYTQFITIYNKHCKEFNKNGKYPFENGSISNDFTREEYDIVLLLSVLFAPHRYRIMELLHQKNRTDKALFIGLGPGLELSLTKENLKEIHTYDLSVNQFIFSEFPNVQIHIELYTGQNPNYFDAIYLIELLEHLEDPFSLLEICHQSLKKDGKIFLTTATDIPQFDHLYNFPKDHTQFEERVKAIGFSILYKEMIPHNYLTMEIKPCNHFYTLVKYNTP